MNYSPIYMDEIATEGFIKDALSNIFRFGKVDEKTPVETPDKYKEMIVDSAEIFSKNPTESPIGFTFKKVIVDNQRGFIAIQRINYYLLFQHIKDTFGEKKISTIFYKTYNGHDIAKFNKKKYSRGDMRITGLLTPIFFALELSILFSQLYKKYKKNDYKQIAAEIYNNTWLSKADSAVPESVDINYAQSLLVDAYKMKEHQINFIKAYPVWKAKMNLRGVYLSFDQGLGKTLTSISLAMALHIDKVYVVCPNTLIGNWIVEINEYYGGKIKAFNCANKSKTPDNDTKVFITNQESIKNLYPHIDKSAKTMLIIDEGHNFRNFKGTRVAELLKLSNTLGPSDILPMSGTPLKASPNELVPAFLLLDPTFTITAAEMYNKCFNFDNYQAMEIVTSRLGKMIYRKMKSEVLPDLPPKISKDILVQIKDPSPYLLKNIRKEVMEEYYRVFPEVISQNKNILDEFVEVVTKYSTAGNIPTKLYLGRIAVAANPEDESSIETMHELDAKEVNEFLDKYVFSNPMFDKRDINRIRSYESKLIHYNKVAMGRAIGKIYPAKRNSLFCAMWDENEDFFVNMINDSLKKTVIFSQFYPVVDHIKERLKANGIGVVSISGNVNNNDRISVLTNFKHNEDIRVIIATSQSMGTGVTLTEANLLLFFGPPWRSTDYDQCADRIYRLGQDCEVTIGNVVLNTNELNLSSKMDKILKWSANMFHSAIDSTIVSEAEESTLLFDKYKI